VLNQLYNKLDGQPIDVVLSDMAPNLSGNKDTDQAGAIYLGELALDTAVHVLTKGGVFLVKMFQGVGFDAYHRQIKEAFSSVVIRKPKASRPRSTEVYILARGFNPKICPYIY
jgi:23S rRNA (uridine2552-2'-O)-methyltransferase